MTRQVSTLNVLASSQQPKTSRQDNNIALSRLIKLTTTMIQQQLLSMIWNYYNTDKSPSPISITISLLANRPSNISSRSPRDQNQTVIISTITTMTNTWSQIVIFPAITTMTKTWSPTSSSTSCQTVAAHNISSYKSPISHSVMWVLIEWCDLVRTHAHDRGRGYR